MILSRRSVLFGLIAAPIVVRAGLIMPVHSDVPWIVGDGVHDDAPGLQALIDGKRHRVSRNFCGLVDNTNGIVQIRSGRFRIGKMLDTRAAEFYMTDSHLIAETDAGGALLLNDKCTVVSNCFTFDGSRERWRDRSDPIIFQGSATHDRL
jgi:hypothetical protein